MAQTGAASEHDPAQKDLEQERRRRFLRTYWKVSLIVLVVLISAVIVVNRDKLGQLGRYGYFGVFLISVIGNATVILPAPSLALVFAMGATLQPALVGLAAGAGEAIGEMTGYVAGYGGRAVVEKTDAYQRIQALMARYGLLFIFALSVIPNPFFDLAGIAAGALRIPPWQFLLVCWIGKTIKTTAFAFLGASSLGLVESWL